MPRLLARLDALEQRLDQLDGGSRSVISAPAESPALITTLQRVPGAVSAAAEISGSARGRLVGGNLAALATSIGARVPSLSGAFLFLEDQRVVGLGTIDRQLTQLIDSAALDGVVGVALGSFEGFRNYSGDRLGQLGVPVLGGLFAGHDLFGPNGPPDQTALPVGSLATLNTADGTLTSDPIVS